MLKFNELCSLFEYEYCMKKTLIITLLCLFSVAIPAQEVLSLDTCRARALRANRGLKQSELKVQEGDALERVAMWQMLPKVSATGGYMWMQRSINLLSEEQKNELNHLGERVQEGMHEAIREELSDLPIGGDWLADRLTNLFANEGLTNQLNDLGGNLVQDLETDTRQMGGAVVTLTQPIYMGGKLAAAHRISQLTRNLSAVQLDQKQQQTLIEVDEAYWQVVSVEHKRALAEQFANLLDTLENNVQLMVEAEVATKSDLAKVRVKRSEAQMTLTKANNGLRLAKMLLAERCGMPLDSDFSVADADLEDQAVQMQPLSVDMQSVYDNRNEMKMLRIADSVAHQAERMAAGSLKPNIMATGGYLATNPNVFDGFSNTWGGTWMAGVVVNVPIVHPGGYYALRAARLKRKEVAYQQEEAQEMIALQVKKVQYELELAYKHLDEALTNQELADDNVELATESFRAGVCSSSDLLAAETAWMQARGEVIDAHIEIAMGKVYMRQALGNR